MKKLLCLLLFCLLLFSVASAWDGEYTEVWFDYEATTYANEFVAVPEVGLQICVPDPLVQYELIDVNREYGIVAIFWTENGEGMNVRQTYELDHSGDPVSSLFNYYETLLENGVQMESADMLLLNGMPAFVYTDIWLDERYVVFVDEELPGYVTTVTFTHATSHPEFMAITAETIPGIMPYAG